MFDNLGVDEEFVEAMLIRVIVTSAGSDLVEPPAFLVSCIEEDLAGRAGLGIDDDDIDRSDAIVLAAEMLSRATSVTAAAFDLRGHDFMYQLYSQRVSAMNWS